MQDTGIRGSAMPVDLFINLAQDYADSGYNHEYLKRIFSVGREVQLSDLDIDDHKVLQYDFRPKKLEMVAEKPSSYGEDK